MGGRRRLRIFCHGKLSFIVELTVFPFPVLLLFLGLIKYFNAINSVIITKKKYDSSDFTCFPYHLKTEDPFLVYGCEEADGGSDLAPWA